MTLRVTSRDILTLQGGDTEQSQSASRLVMFQIQLANRLEIAIVMHVSVYIYSRFTLPARM